MILDLSECVCQAFPIFFVCQNIGTVINYHRVTSLTADCAMLKFTKLKGIHNVRTHAILPLP